ncbi:MAG: GAF domain-containing protein [Gammaproteobacteria bacterium]|nr:GAF domain-containing protein [Gammaproteobacteria bacterium]
MKTLTINAEDKQSQYAELIPQIKAVISDESDIIANMGNISAMLKETFGWLWVGFYRVDNDNNQLVLGPFQGPLACTRIPLGKGVCGEVWQSAKSQIVDDVLTHPNHIACSSLSRSEIVVPVTDENGSVIAVLDIDADAPSCFDEIDQKNLESICQLLPTTNIK